MQLSYRRWLLGGLLLVASTHAGAQAPVLPAQHAAPELVDRPWVERLERRVERLLPAVMASLGAARRERDPVLVRCLDRTVSELHGTSRQLRYHAERWQNESSDAERRRHQKALRALSGRVDDLARAPELCFTFGIVLPPGETHVEVEREK